MGLSRSVALLWWALGIPSVAFAMTVTPIRVIDGDTLTVSSSVSPGILTVRLWGIDAPEFAQEAGAAAKRTLEVLARRCPCLVTRTAAASFGRQVFRLALADGRDMGEQMLRTGHAWWVQRYAPNMAAYALAEEAARRARRGVWQQHMPVPPWEWRRGKRLPSG